MARRGAPESLADAANEDRDAGLRRKDLDGCPRRPEAAVAVGDSEARRRIRSDRSADLAVAHRDAARNLVRQPMGRGRLHLADGVAVEEIHAVEIGQQVPLEESADDFVHSLRGDLEPNRGIPGAALEADRVALARGGIRVVFDRRDPRQDGPAARGARFDHAMEAAHEHDGAVSEVVPQRRSRPDAVAARHVPADHSTLDFHPRKEPQRRRGGEIGVGTRRNECPFGADTRRSHG